MEFGIPLPGIVLNLRLVLRSKKIREPIGSRLFHANTVRTSKTFIEHGAILSRKYIEDHELNQTPQKSDQIDKKFEIWDLIFSLDLLQKVSIPSVRITRKNPIYWRDEDTEEMKYYMSTDEFKSDFKSGNKLRDGGNHIILSTLSGKLPFDDTLFGIQIDNPGASCLAQVLLFRK